MKLFKEVKVLKALWIIKQCHGTQAIPNGKKIWSFSWEGGIRLISPFSNLA